MRRRITSGHPPTPSHERPSFTRPRAATAMLRYKGHGKRACETVGRSRTGRRAPSMRLRENRLWGGARSQPRRPVSAKCVLASEQDSWLTNPGHTAQSNDFSSSASVTAKRRTRRAPNSALAERPSHSSPSFRSMRMSTPIQLPSSIANGCLVWNHGVRGPVAKTVYRSLSTSTRVCWSSNQRTP